MRDGGARGLVCGFGDLGSGVGGLAWDLAGGGGILLSDGATAVADATLADGDEVRVELAVEDPVEATLVPRRDPVSLSGSAPPLEAASCEASARSVGWARTVPTSAHLSRWGADPLDGAATFRHLAIELETGSLLVITARGEPGIEGHGEERTSAWLLDPEGGASGSEEALLSTQYDARGRPTRAGLELWPGDDAPPTRIAASLLGGAEHGGTWAGFFRCRADGAEGLGSYLLWRS
jgi:hypothetical protein